MNFWKDTAMKKQKAASDQPQVSPEKGKESRLNVPTDVDQKVDWQKKMGDGDKSRNLRGNDAKRLKGGKRGA
jgi:hypothetical protein